MVNAGLARARCGTAGIQRFLEGFARCTLVAEAKMLLKINDAAKFLSISRAHLYRLIKAGLLSPTKLGGATRISSTEIERFISEATRRNRVAEQ